MSTESNKSTEYYSSAAQTRIHQIFILL